MSQGYKQAEPPMLSQLSQAIKDRICNDQNVLVKEWDRMEESRQFVTAWLLLEEGERKRHLLKGMEKACQHASLHQELRALCPEITITSMLRQKGKAFVEFVAAYGKGKKDVIDGNPYFLPSEWWDKAEKDVPQALSEECAQSIFAILTLQRNEFICESINAHDGYV
jgi:hypothetical protein